tara:strand:+ start:1933 stop:2064 length:132 start_codon:yes stop_codon:yes gene_type:complete
MKRFKIGLVGNGFGFVESDTVSGRSLGSDIVNCGCEEKADSLS